MNATKRLLTVAAITAGALGIGAGAFFACRQELTPGAQDGSPGAERRPDYAKYDDGEYDFYFKNGFHIYGDCDGYNSEPGGKTTIYEYFKSGINKWEKRLKAVGISTDVYRTSNLGKYCRIRFDTDLLVGIGVEAFESYNGILNNDEVDFIVNGARFNIKETKLLHYAPAHGSFGNRVSENHRKHADVIKRISNDQKKRDVPAIYLSLYEQRTDKVLNRIVEYFEKAGVSIIEKGFDNSFSSAMEDYAYILLDASNISWFAYNQ